MLFILNATSTIGVKFIACEFLKAFNSQTIDDHFVELSPIRVANKDGNIVYDIESGENQLVQNNPNLFQKIVKLDVDLIDLSHQEHYRDNAFDDFYYDYGITNSLMIDLWQNAPEFIDGVLTQHNDGVSYQKTFNNYVNRPNYVDNYVISGQFSKGIVERFQKDLGEENVVVVNFLRNPSAVTAIHIEDEEYFLQPERVSKDFHNLKIFESILSNIALMSVKGVINVKFEDFLKDKFIQIKNKKIILPKLYKNFNSILTEWEKEKIIKNKICTSDKIEYYNNILSDCSKSVDEFLECTKFNINSELIDLYIKKISDGEKVDPICVHFYNGKYLMSDGLNRFFAYKRLNIKQIPVHDGTKLFSMSDEELDDILKNDDEYEYKDSEKNRLLERLPYNMFTSMGYQPLTLNQLLQLYN